MSAVARFRRAFKYAERSLAIRRQFNDLWGQGQTLNFYGVALYAASRYSSADKAREARRLLERTGDRWEAMTSLYHLGLSLYRKGELHESEQVAHQIYREGSELGDYMQTGFAQEIIAKATGGLVDPETLRKQIELAEGDAQRQQALYQAEGLRAFWHGKAAHAVRSFERAAALIKEHSLRSEYVTCVPVWLASALRRQLEEARYMPKEKRAALQQRARRVARRALRVARTFRNNLPHILRENGILSALEGNEHQARKFLEQSLSVAERQGQRLEHAESLLAHGKSAANSVGPMLRTRYARRRNDCWRWEPASCCVETIHPHSDAAATQSILLPFLSRTAFPPYWMRAANSHPP